MRIKCYEGERTIQDFNYELERGQCRVSFGRGTDCDVQVQFSPSVSRRQAVIEWAQGAGWAIVDGDGITPSAAGVFVDGQRIRERTPIGESSQIELFRNRDCRIVLSLGDETEPLTGDEETLNTDRRQSLSAPSLPLPSAIGTDRRVQTQTAVADRPKVPSPNPVSLRDDVAKLREDVTRLALAISDHEERCRAKGDESLKVIRDMAQTQAARMAQLETAIHTRLDVVHATDARQDRTLRMALGAVVLTVLCSAAIATGRPYEKDTVRQITDVVEAIAAIGGGGLLLAGTRGDGGRYRGRLRHDGDDSAPPAGDPFRAE